MSAQSLNGLIKTERVICVRAPALAPSPYTVMSEDRWPGDPLFLPLCSLSSPHLSLPRCEKQLCVSRRRPLSRILGLSCEAEPLAPATLRLICSARSGASDSIKGTSLSVCIPQTLHVWFEWCNLAATGALNLVFFFPL